MDNIATLALNSKVDEKIESKKIEDKASKILRIVGDVKSDFDSTKLDKSDILSLIKQLEKIVVVKEAPKKSTKEVASEAFDSAVEANTPEPTV